MTPPKGAKAKADAPDTPPLEGAGMAGIGYELRRYGMAGAAYVSSAAVAAEEARGNEPGDLIIVSIPAGELADAMEALAELGVRRAALRPASG